MCAGIVTCFIFSIFIIFVTACQSPGVSAQILADKWGLKYGFHNIFGIDVKTCVVFSIIPMYASAFGFLFASKHQIHAMAQSGMLPPFLKPVYGPNRVPIPALVTTVFVQYCVYLIVWAVDHAASLFLITASAACFMYVAVLAGFIKFRLKFAHMERVFSSPFGIPGAAVGITIFTFTGITLIGFQSHYHHIGVYFGFMALMTIYYLLVAQKTQYFSKEEQEKFMKAYIVNGKNRHHSLCRRSFFL